MSPPPPPGWTTTVGAAARTTRGARMRAYCSAGEAWATPVGRLGRLLVRWQGRLKACGAPSSPRRSCQGAVTEGAALEPRGQALMVDELGLAGRHAGHSRHVQPRCTGARPRGKEHGQLLAVTREQVATEPAARTGGSSCTPKRRTRPPRWQRLRSAGWPELATPRPPSPEQIEDGMECGRSRVRRPAAAHCAAPC